MNQLNDVTIGSFLDVLIIKVEIQHC